MAIQNSHLNPASPLRQSRSKEAMNSSYSSTFVISWDIGFVMMMVGIVGFFYPHFFGLNLSLMHNLVLVTFGALAVLSGMTDSKMAYKINLASGVFFLLNAFLGALIGDRGHLTLGYGSSEDVIVKMAPGFLELSTYDHVFHLAIAVFFFIQAYSWNRKSHDFPDNLKSQRTEKSDIN